MRVTASSFPNVLRSQLERLSTQQARLQTQAGTGQRFQLASEDPRAMRKVLDLQTEIKSLTQYEKNIGTLRDTLTASFAAINHLKKISDRAGEIATRGDTLRTKEELQALSTEVNQLIEEAVQLANTRHQSNYIFGGTKNTTPPFAVTRDAQNLITGATYQGSATINESEIAESINISVTVPGANTTGSGPRGLLQDTSAGADLIGHLISLRDNLLNNNTAAIRIMRLARSTSDRRLVDHSFQVMNLAPHVPKRAVIVGRDRRVAPRLELLDLGLDLTLVEADHFVMLVHFDMEGATKRLKEVLLVQLGVALQLVVLDAGGDLAKLSYGFLLQFFKGVSHCILSIRVFRRKACSLS